MSSHASDDALERYSMGTCSEEETAELEEHLLVCHSCQDRAAEADLLIKPLRAALAREQSRPLTARKGGSFFRRIWPPSQRFVWVPALGTLLLVAAGWQDFREFNAPPQRIALAAFRGADTDATTHASTGAPIDLQLDLSAVRRSPRYRIEIVSASGAVEKRGLLGAAADSAHFDAGRLSTGRHWVRLYDDGGNLLQEYGLSVD